MKTTAQKKINNINCQCITSLLKFMAVKILIVQLFICFIVAFYQQTAPDGRITIQLAKNRQ